MLRLWKWLVLGLVVVVGLAFAGWYFFLKTDPEPRAAIKDTPVVTESTVAGETDARYRRHLDGEAGQRSDNFVGYRVTEKLFANISESEATGRTDNVTGTMTIDGTTISDVTVTADLRDLTSDNSFRDGRIRSEGLESDQFPEAKFVLTAPITLAAVADRRRRRSRPRPPATSPCTASPSTVTVSLEGRWDGKQVQVVGNLPDRVRRLRHHRTHRARGRVGRRPRRDGAAALLRQELSDSPHTASRESRHSRRKFGSSPTAAHGRCLVRGDHRGSGGQQTNSQRLRKAAETMNLFVLRTWLEAKFAKDERGASMVEYILLVALIALAVIAAVVFLKDQVNGKFNDAGSKLSSSGS